MNDTKHPTERRGETAEQNHLGEKRPKLPHEHDESAGSQASQPREVMRQAKADVDSGQEDTDLRGSQGRREKTVPPSTGRG